MAATNIAISHASTGLLHAEVTGATRISPHFVRLTVAGEGLAAWRDLGFDQWFRLAVPAGRETRLDRLPSNYKMSGYLKYLSLPRGTRPAIRNYTVRGFRADAGEIDIDFVVHGTGGVAGPWAAALPVGAPVALIDQGRGYRTPDAASVLLAGDESALPAIAGILRDMPRSARGRAVLEIPDEADRQPLAGPDGVEVDWLVRRDGEPAGRAALRHVRGLPRPEDLSAGFAAGESALATGVRRHLVNDWGVPKSGVTFCGYWRQGAAG